MNNALMTPRSALPEPMPRLAMNLSEAARALGVSAKWLSAQAKSGQVPHCKMGKLLLFSVSALDSWLKEKCTQPALPAAQQPQRTG